MAQRTLVQCYIQLALAPQKKWALNASKHLSLKARLEYLSKHQGGRLSVCQKVVIGTCQAVAVVEQTSRKNENNDGSNCSTQTQGSEVMTADTTAPRFTLIDIANQLENVGCFSSHYQRDHAVALIRQAAADLASRPTEDQLKVVVREYAASIRTSGDDPATDADPARADDIAAILSAHTPYIIQALIAAGVKVRP